MNNKILTLTKMIQNENIQILTIPEIGIKLTVESPLLIATMLSPFIDDFPEEETEPIAEKDFDEKIIKQAIKKIRDIEENNIIYLILIGADAAKTYEFAKTRWKNKILDNNKFKPIIKENEIILPIKENTILDDDIKIVSSAGSTIYKISKNRTVTYSNGKAFLISSINDPAFFHLINGLGYLLDEFLLAETILRIYSNAPHLKKMLLENINTAFVKSLGVHSDFGKYYPFQGYKTPYLSRFLRISIEILTTIAFSRIKDYSYEFVSAFMYENKG